jgi:peptidoglycan/xylan/chitin deacetylase (PgdA/CDA1 family)
MIPRSTLKRLARRVVSSGASLSGYCLLSKVFRMGRGARILCYHSICDEPTSTFAVSTQDFARQMEFLTAQYSLTTVDQIAARLREGRPPLSRSVAVTIDDGYEDAYTYAYPILKEFEIPATLFLSVRFIGMSASRKAVSGVSTSNFLTWQQVRTMASEGITFGSHTLNHNSLTSLTREAVTYQLEQSKLRLEAELGEPVTGLSYPYGSFRDFDKSVKRSAATAGYLWAVTGINGINHHRADLFALRRTKVEKDDGMVVFRRAMRGALDPWVIIDRLDRFLQKREAPLSGISE